MGNKFDVRVKQTKMAHGRVDLALANSGAVVDDLALQVGHVDAVKIDGAYIMNILQNERDRSMVTNLVRMCADLKVGVVAERVETKEIADLLKTIGVDYGQGYYYAKPLDEPNYKPK